MAQPDLPTDPPAFEHNLIDALAVAADLTLLFNRDFCSRQNREKSLTLAGEERLAAKKHKSLRPRDMGPSGLALAAENHHMSSEKKTRTVKTSVTASCT